jgi:hypothetical protein
MTAPRKCRHDVIDTFARWTALSSARSGRHLKSGADIYPLLQAVDFKRWFVGGGGRRPSVRNFDKWHRGTVERLANRRLSVGWAAKLVNVYLKTACYVGDLGRPGIRGVLHPPIDSGLWAGIKARFPEHRVLKNKMPIDGIKTYDTYEQIIEGCREIADELGCQLVEVDQLSDLGTRRHRPGRK